MVAGSVLSLSPGGRALRWLVLSGAIACFALTLAAASGVAPQSSSFGCTEAEWMVALLPLLTLLVLLTGFAFDWTRALVGAVAVLSAGVLAVHLHCPDGRLSHQALFHLAPVALTAAVAAVVRWRLPSRSHVP
jgi:hypothetical protein